ncbi:hypothetical protein HUE87_10355 [Candidatus Sulfurimonas marisnigri]|uniref:Uncharacterized protein n=1 Tax=Candidatus Sulfurimonas marisnigri TaxID=2740405 RepID=A0A7S7RPE0_9BACT|nr:hypothetical protein [Candidatus Sulfurimonas marisnigri]QOY54267.1 hypothetical protein HUE87_10355 [Candidatus Sulfurimonas marisnigri]
MIAKLIDAFYTKIFINIIVEGTTSVVYVEVCSQGTVVDSVQMRFDTISINSKMYEFIKNYIKSSPYYYISILDKSLTQGAVPTCTAGDMSDYIDVDSSKSVCISNALAVYTSEDEIRLINKEYKSIGLDFIFSPFVIMTRFFNDKIERHFAMFLLVEDLNISFTIFDNSKLLYAKYLNINTNDDKEGLLIDSSLDEDILLDMDDIDLEEVDSDDLDDFGDIEDLDSSDDIDEFAEALDMKEIVEESYEVEEEEGFNEDYKRFLLIHDCVNSFYKDEECNSDFVESIFIADAIGVSKDLKRYLEEEMFLSVVIRKIDLCVEVCEMAKAELL